MALGYDMQIVEDQSTSTTTVNGTQYTYPNFAWADLILPNGRRVRYHRLSSGTYWEGAQYQNPNFPGEYFGSNLHDERELLITF
jgi:hypothetical protein